MSTTGGFELYLQDRSGGSLESLAQAAQRFIQAANQRPELAGVSTTFNTGVPQYSIDVDREKAKALGVPITTIFDTMQSTFGSLYVNDFSLFGRTYRVSLSSEGEFRQSPDDLRHVFVRSANSTMVPLDVLVSVSRIMGPDVVYRFNVFPAAQIQGNPGAGVLVRPGHRSHAGGRFTDALVGLLDRLDGIRLSGIQSAGTGSQGFLFGLVMVFLILAAQYERWSLPLAVIMAVPFAVFGAILAIYLRGSRTTSISRSAW